jgi:hypothetical protein
VKLPKILRGTPAVGEGVSSEPSRRRRRTVRPDAPRTIIPLDDVAADARPSWLHDTPSTPLSLDLDAARARLRREIPPVVDDDV